MAEIKSGILSQVTAAAVKEVTEEVTEEAKAEEVTEEAAEEAAEEAKVVETELIVEEPQVQADGTFKVVLKGTLRCNGVVTRPGQSTIVSKKLYEQLKTQGMV